MELKVKQLEEAQSRLKVKPEAMPNESPHSGNGATRIGGICTRRSLPSTPSEDVDTWSKFNLTKELEEARKILKLKDQEILQLRAQVLPKTPPQSPTITTNSSERFKSPLQIAERSKNSSISFDGNKVHAAAKKNAQQRAPSERRLFFEAIFLVIMCPCSLMDF